MQEEGGRGSNAAMGSGRGRERLLYRTSYLLTTDHDACIAITLFLCMLFSSSVFSSMLYPLIGKF